MVWQNTVAIKDLSKASLLCLVFQEDAGRTWNRFFFIAPKTSAEGARILAEMGDCYGV